MKSQTFKLTFVLLFAWMSFQATGQSCCPSYIQDYVETAYLPYDGFGVDNVQSFLIPSGDKIPSNMGAAAEANAKKFYSILNQSYVYVKPDPKNEVQIVQKNTFLIPKSPNSQFFMKFQQVKTWGFDSRYNTFVEFSADGGQTWTTKFMDLSLMFMGEEICIEYHINYKNILAAFQKIDPNMTLAKLLETPLNYRYNYVPKTSTEKKEYLRTHPHFVKLTAGASVKNLNFLHLLVDDEDGTGVTGGSTGSGSLAPPPR
ncbi:hypothetical protein [Flectobacillus roseus]|uniref:Uncharacterized protein n=1 Tax=Flectobacillus roseus TaxID=502259 RepID=A0ABT6Y7Q3_9BACT|nr:hypothetical protein [Flectobacillus roseus]MDI9859585.1 hypothetical protein [Flectobacillus roseus]